MLCRDQIISLKTLKEELQNNSSYLLNELEPFFKLEYKKLFRENWKLFSHLIQ